MKTVSLHKEVLTVSALLAVPEESAWLYYTRPEDIVNWNFASEEWYCPFAENDLRKDGGFTYRMEARDGSMGFDFSGVYTEVEKFFRISYRLDDEREVDVSFGRKDEQTEVSIRFQIENVYPPEQQQAGWQAILDNYKSYAEKMYREALF